MNFVTEADGTLSIYLMGNHNSKGWISLFRARNVSNAEGTFPLEFVVDTGFTDDPADQYDSFFGLATLDDNSFVIVSRGYESVNCFSFAVCRGIRALSCGVFATHAGTPMSVV